MVDVECELSAKQVMEKHGNAVNQAECFLFGLGVIFLGLGKAADSIIDWVKTQAVGSLMYAMIATQSDIAHVNKFMHNPGQSHCNAVKHVFRYLVGTKDLDILFSPNDVPSVVGYTDSDFAGCINSCKSTTGYCFKFGNGGISWKSKL